MNITRFTPVSAGGQMVGFIDIDTNGILIRGAKLMKGQRGSHWVAMPSTKRVDRDGNPVTDPTTGKQLYDEHVGFRDREIRDKFRDAALEALRRAHPQALGANAAELDDDIPFA